jgi:hypothetical protein
MRRRSVQNGLLLYILLNIIVSAATTLAVMMIWDRVKQSEMPPQVATLPAIAATTPLSVTTTPQPETTPTGTAQANAGPLIEINQVIGAGDVTQEYVLLKRLGEGDLNMAGWKLKDEDGNVFAFPTNPELVLFKGGAVQIYTRVGVDTPTEIYWNRTEPVWKVGEQVTLVDANGTVQATFKVP